MHLRSLVTLAALSLVATVAVSAVATAKTDQSFWPRINGMLLMNKTDRDRPLDARPGRDPFGGQDRSYSCDAVHNRGTCQRLLVSDGRGGRVVGRRKVHHKLLGGHGSDTINAGPYGDVIWGDYKPSGQPTSQRDRLTGGGSRDYIYASHGHNTIRAGGGSDYVKAHHGRGSVDCGSGRRDRLYISRRAKPRYTIRNCETVSHKTLGR